ncbi:MAG: hypothetical protein JF612_06670 [Planctomycetia bacterium]|nr:hypothetical protein [Planctomycetia bacterium]
MSDVIFASHRAPIAHVPLKANFPYTDKRRLLSAATNHDGQRRPLEFH